MTVTAADHPTFSHADARRLSFQPLLYISDWKQMKFMSFLILMVSEYKQEHETFELFYLTPPFSTYVE